MSGVEAVVGLVLGGFPLLISAVESHRKGFEALGCLREFRAEYRRCHNRLRELELLYDLLLDKLFYSVVDSEEELSDLKSHPHEKGWAHVEARLQKRLLPRVCAVYQNTMTDLKEVKDELGAEKPLFQDCEAPRSNSIPKEKYLRIKDKMSYETQRAKFSAGKTSREELFDQVKTLIDRLANLLIQNNEAAALRSDFVQKPNTRAQKALFQLWRHAQNIYILLSKSWTCGCRKDHCADLLLQHRITPEARWEIIFHFSTASLQAQSPWTCQTILISKFEPAVAPDVRGSDTASSSDRPLTKTKTKPSNALRLVSALRKFKTRPSAGSGSTSSVAFAVSSSSKSVATQAQTFVDQFPEPKALGNASLCHLISRGPKISQRLCVLADQEVDEEYSMVATNSPQGMINSTDFVTLGSLLRSNVDARPSRRHRNIIALAITSSHLQLHSSEWLGAQWSNEGIFFVMDDGQPRITEPYLRKDFNSKPRSPQKSTSSIDDTFVTLSILLLELAFGEILDESPFRQKFLAPGNHSDFIQDWAAARGWADLLEGETGSGYADAVDWCLARRRTRDNDIVWRQELEQKVIQPLRQNCF